MPTRGRNSSTPLVQSGQMNTPEPENRVWYTGLLPNHLYRVYSDELNAAFLAAFEHLGSAPAAARELELNPATCRMWAKASRLALGWATPGLRRLNPLSCPAGSTTSVQLPRNYP